MCFPKAWWVKILCYLWPQVHSYFAMFPSKHFFQHATIYNGLCPLARCSQKMLIQLDFDFTHLIIAQSFVLGLMLTPWKHRIHLEQPIDLSNFLCPLLCNIPKQKQFEGNIVLPFSLTCTLCHHHNMLGFGNGGFVFQVL